MSEVIPLSVPCLNEREIDYISKCINENWVSTAGSYVDHFEDRIAEFTAVNHAIAVNSGTSALHLALLALGVTAMDEVLVPALTFIATANVVRYVGADPVFMDCDEFLNIDPQKVIKFLTEECVFDGDVLRRRKSGRRVKAIIVVHVFGCPVNLAPILEISKQYNLRVIEDAAESIGAYYSGGALHGKKTGAIGDVACYSFNGNKMITTGAGGMVLTNDPEISQRCKYLSTQAKDNDHYYIHNEVGFNYRMSNIQAAMGVAQLEKLSSFIDIKESNLLLYKHELSGVAGVSLLDSPPWGKSNNWFYALLLDNRKHGRDELIKKFEAESIQTRPLWKPNHLQKPYLSCDAYEISNVDYYYERVINIPCSVNLRRKDIERVCEVIKSNE